MAAGLIDTGWRPLHGRRVVSFGWVVSGPIVGRYLTDLGAEVIKIESVSRPDNVRLRRAVKRGIIDWSVANNVPLFHAINRGVRSLSVDVKRNEGLEVVKALIARSDAVVENFTAGTLERMGLGDDVLRAVNPRLVRLSLTAAGRTGRFARLRAYAATTGSLAGLENAVGYSDADGPIGMLTFGAADYASGAVGAFALVAALSPRGDRTFRAIDASQLEATVIGLGSAFAAQAAGLRPRPGNSSYLHAPEGVYRSADDRFVAFAIHDDAEWARFAPLLGQTVVGLDYEDDRLRQRAAVDVRVSQWMRRLSREEAVSTLRALDLRVAPVLSMEDRSRDPYILEHGMTDQAQLHDRKVDVPRAPWRVDGALLSGSSRAPDLGEDTDYVCTEIIGLAHGRVDELMRDRVLFAPKRASAPDA